MEKVFKKGDAVLDILLAVYETEKNRLPQGKSNYSPTFIDAVEKILCHIDPSLMIANYGVAR